MLQGNAEAESLHLFSPAIVGVPLVFLGILYFVVVGHRLLPERLGAAESVTDARKYGVSMRVVAGGTLSGMTIADAGLRHLQYSFLSEIQSDGHIIPAVGPEEILSDNDILIFVVQHTIQEQCTNNIIQSPPLSRRLHIQIKTKNITIQH